VRPETGKRNFLLFFFLFGVVIKERKNTSRFLEKQISARSPEMKNLFLSSLFHE
jgi:hypothetical protein